MLECGSLPEAIFNYVLTVEDYVFALSEEKMPENCERARKIVKELGKGAKLCKWFLFSFMRSKISFFIHALSWKNMCERAKSSSSTSFSSKNIVTSNNQFQCFWSNNWEWERCQFSIWEFIKVQLLANWKSGLCNIINCFFVA